MKILYDKWTLYDTVTCPRCFENTETDQYIWSCPKSELALKSISDKLDAKYRLPHNLKPSITLLAQGIPMMALISFLRKKTKSFLSLSSDSPPTGKDMT